MRLRFITYNIHKGIGGIDRRYRLERIVEAIAHYDPALVFLQEVAGGGPRVAEERQVDRIADALGLRHREWYENHRFRSGLHYGNAVLSRFPISRAQNIDVTLPRKKARSVLHVHLRVRLPKGRGGTRTRTLHGYNLHLGLSERERERQLALFLESDPFRGLHRAAPILVAGDFNDVWGGLGRKLLQPAGFTGLPRPIRTFPAWAPMRALDSIYRRGDLEMVHVHASRLKVAKTASDHLPLIAECSLHA